MLPTVLTTMLPRPSPPFPPRNTRQRARRSATPVHPLTVQLGSRLPSTPQAVRLSPRVPSRRLSGTPPRWLGALALLLCLAIPPRVDLAWSLTHPNNEFGYPCSRFKCGCSLTRRSWQWRRRSRARFVARTPGPDREVVLSNQIISGSSLRDRSPLEGVLGLRYRFEPDPDRPNQRGLLARGSAGLARPLASGEPPRPRRTARRPPCPCRETRSVRCSSRPRARTESAPCCCAILA